MPGMYGFGVVGRAAPPSPAAAARLDAEHASDVARARSADATFCASIEASGGGAGRVIVAAAAAREEDSDVSMEDDSSNNVGGRERESGSGSCSGGGGDSGEEEDGIDGVPMPPLLPPPSADGLGVRLPSTAMEPEEQGSYCAPVTLPLPPPLLQASMPQPPGKRNEVSSAAQAGVLVAEASKLPPAATVAALRAQATRDGEEVDGYAEAQAPHPAAEGRMGKVETVLARGDRLMREAA
ncbi:unnamed protein product, partial [Laminaria digitata]